MCTERIYGSTGGQKMKVKIVASFASVLLLAVGFAQAKTTSEECSWPQKRMPPMRYTVNYAVSNSSATPVAETAIHIINRSRKNEACVYVVFKDKDGVEKGVAQGFIPANGSKVFATATTADAVSPPPPFVVDYAATVVNTDTPDLPLQTPFEGRAEIYSRNPSMQVAPFMTSGSSISNLPVQKSVQSTKGGH